MNWEGVIGLVITAVRGYVNQHRSLWQIRFEDDLGQTKNCGSTQGGANQSLVKGKHMSSAKQAPQSPKRHKGSAKQHL
jgi:hypothetical protein